MLNSSKIFKFIPKLFSKKGNSFLVSIYNPYSPDLYQVENNGDVTNFIPVPAREQKRQRGRKIFSFLANTDFTFDTIDISKNIPDDEVEDALYGIIYEELDNSIEYHIVFDEIKKGENEKGEFRTFNIFIIDPNIAQYVSSTISRTIKYIDRVYPLPLLFKSIYKFSAILDRTECFIYTYRDGTSFNLFINGELIYTKALIFSTINFFEKFVELTEEEISYPEFCKIVTIENILLSKNKYRSALTKSFFSLFDEINDIINYIKRNFSIEKIDNLYYSSNIGNILGLAEYSRTSVAEHSFNGFLNEFSVKFPEGLDEIHYLVYLTYQLNSSRNIYLTVLKPPLPFYERQSGKLILATVGSVFLSILYPWYNYHMTHFLNINIEKKRESIILIREKYNDRKAELDKYDAEISKVKSEFDIHKKRFDDKFNLLNDIYQKRVSYTMKGAEILKFTISLNSHKVLVSTIQYSQDEAKDKIQGSFKLDILATDDIYITNLLKYLIKEREIYTDNIELDRGIDHYRAKLKILDSINLGASEQ